MREDVTFAKLGFSFGMLNGTAGYVKLYPLGSIVIVPKARKGWVAMSPRRSRVRAGVLVELGSHKGKGLRAFLLRLDCICRIPDSWIWRDDTTGSLNSPQGSRKVRKLHWKGGAHASNSKGRKPFIPFRESRYTN